MSLKHLQDSELRPIRVVLCDDHLPYAVGLSTLLAIESPEVWVAGIADSFEEVEKVACEVAADVILMDLYLPRRLEIDATAKLASRFLVIILTVSDHTQDLFDALKAGAVGFLSKSASVSDIVTAIKGAVHGFTLLPSQTVADLWKRLGNPDARSAIDVIDREMIRLIAAGEPYKSVAVKLRISERTIRRRVAAVCRQLGVANRFEAAAFLSGHSMELPTETSLLRE